MKNSILIITLIVILVSCSQKVKGIENISVSKLKIELKKDKNLQLLDVRTPRECASGTIEDALEINVKESTFIENALAKLNKNKPVYVYCRSGGRSKKASKLLSEKGFKVYNIEGGYMKWLNEKK